MGKIVLEPSIVPEIVGNYENARDCFQEGDNNIAPAAVLLETPRLDEFLDDAGEIILFIQFLSYDFVSINEGCTTFCKKLAQLALELSEIEGDIYQKIDDLLIKYPCLTEYLNKLKDYYSGGGTLSGFDESNMADYTLWQNSFENLKDDLIDAFKNYDGDVEKLKDDLKRIFNNEELNTFLDTFIDSMIDSLKLDSNNSSGNINRSLGLGVSIITVGLYAFFYIASGNDPKALESVAVVGANAGGDTYFNLSDSSLWSLNGPISLILDSWGVEASGPIASVVVSLLIACSDGEFDPQRFFEEAFPAVTGASVTSGLTALGCGVFLPILIGFGLTVGAGLLVSEILDCAGIDRYYDAWGEKEQKEYLRNTYGIDVEIIEFLKNIIDSGYVNDEIITIINNYFKNSIIPSNTFASLDSSYYDAAVIEICYTFTDLVCGDYEDIEAALGTLLSYYGIYEKNSDGTENPYYDEALDHLIALRDALMGDNKS